jgi:hypothetical protein
MRMGGRWRLSSRTEVAEIVLVLKDPLRRSCFRRLGESAQISLAAGPPPSFGVYWLTRIKVPKNLVSRQNIPFIPDQ